MVEQEQMKVYELAKELGVDSISLLDKLSGLNIKVKNHMSELGSEEVRIARSSLGPNSGAKGTAKTAGKTAGTKSAAGTATKSASAKSTTTRKKASPASDGLGAGLAAGLSSPSGSNTNRTASKAATAAPAVEAPAPKTAPSVIRRRTKAEGEETTASTPATRTTQTRTQESAHTEASEHSEESDDVQTHHAGQEAGAETAYAGSSSAQDESDETSSNENSTGTSAEGNLKTAAALEAGAQDSATEATPAAAKRAPVVLPPRPVAPRRSILKIVEVSAPAPRPMIKPAPSPVTAVGAKPVAGVKGVSTQDKDGFRIIKMDKTNLDAMVEEEAAKKRGIGPRENEIRPEDVRFADYRKKEMVFMPKKKKIPLGKEIRKTQKTVSKQQKRVVTMGDHVTIQDFAAQLGVKAVEVIRKLMGMGTMATINQSIDFDTATVLASEYQYEIRNIAFKEAESLDVATDTDASLISRPPVVTIMGHVDHGKTSLLDAIREADVAKGEAGGITQHIGAYTVNKEGHLITFIDTPGHEAFTVMRARGANVTDIVILVVAADDAVMPQTREALSHAQAAGVPIIVAVNKMDKAGANPERVKQQLAELNLLAEDWGGQTMFVPVSALKKTNLDKLLEAIILQAEVLDLKANPEARASGVILEARIEKGRGPVASVLVKRGTLRVGDAIVAGTFSGKVKALTDDKGRNVKIASPGYAVEILGFEGLPGAGEKFDAPVSDAAAREIVSNRTDRAREANATPATKVNLEDLFSKIQTGVMKELNVVLKGDVFGSVEAIRDSLVKVSNEKVKVKVIFSAPGGISESDVMLASASGAIVIGFNVRPETKARQLAEAEHVEVKCYTIIYELIDDIKKSMAGLLDKKKVERFLGRAEVRQTFSVPKIGMIAGTSVIDGKIIRGANVRLLRDSRIIYEGKMSSLKRFKDDAKEVATGYECGIGLDGFNDLKPGDLIEAYQIDMVAAELNG
ncbi:MAG: translation initiation factor IF-2 [Methylotenera sp.]|nr:translation initiation factor IF-2 [Oligoflexia bacterium]